MLLPEVKRPQLATDALLTTGLGGRGTDARLMKLQSPSPRNSWGQNVKDKTKPTKTHMTNQHSNLRSRQWT